MSRQASGVSLLPSFQTRLTEALKAEGLIPMSSGVSRPVRPASSFSDLFVSATQEVERASVTFGARGPERYSTSVGDSYRDKRFAMIASLENIRTRAYQDTQHNISVGLGFNMDKAGARDVWTQAFGKTVDFDAVKRGEQAITPGQAKQLFDHDIVYFEKVVDTAAGGRALTQNQRLALVSIAYSSPKRVADWGPTIQAGDDATLTSLMLTQSFNPNHPQKEGIKARRYIETAVFTGSGAMKELMPSFEGYMASVKVDDATGNAVVNGQLVAPIPADKPGHLSNAEGLAGLSYQNQHAKRSLKVSPDLEQAIRESVTAVYGADYKVAIMAGTQDPHKEKASSSARHSHARPAADIEIFDPAGKKVRDEALVPLAQHWLASGIGSVGLPGVGNTNWTHVDLIGNKEGTVPLKGKEGVYWFYGKKDKAVENLLIAARDTGAAPKYAISPDIIAKGLVPKASLPAVGTELAVTPVPSSTVKVADLAPLKPLETTKKVVNPQIKPPVPASRASQVKARVNAELARPFTATEYFGDTPLNNAFDAFVAQNKAPVDITKPGPVSPTDALKMLKAADGPNAPPLSAALVAAKKAVGTTGVSIEGTGTLGVSGMTPRTVQQTVVRKPVVAPQPATRPAHLNGPSGPARAPVYGDGGRDYGSSRGQSTSGLKPGDRVYDPDTNSWALK